MTVFVLESFFAGEQITLRAGGSATGIAVTYRVRPEGAGSRLHARVLFGGNRLLAHALAMADLVMMRKQLLTLKARAQGEAKREASV